MKFYKLTKGLLLGALFSAGCFCMAATGFAEAKAFEYDSVLRGSYAHIFRDEFFTRSANVYNSANQINSWGEVISREESGMDGSVKKCWMIGDLTRDSSNKFTLNVRRHVIQKLDNRGKILMSKVEDVDYEINVYHRMESGLRLEWPRTGDGPCSDIDGEYTVSREYPMMSREAAMYVLGKTLNSLPEYRDKLPGAAMTVDGNDMAETYIIRVLEHHPDHVVTRGTYQVSASGNVLEYDVVRDKWQELVH
ncbi:MAG: hypothetical protein Q4D07_06580 [Selenomonadaceae bacterium]|nr:hypothetical protein [Selenomonadaceae bacterium]